jgi:hypothetical protein
MSASPIVSRKTALQRRTAHQFIPGIGYVAHAEPPEFAPHPVGGKNCDPGAGAADGSVHVLRPPNGHPEMRMVWVAAERAWAPERADRGNRLAWTISHLSKAGWEYVGPAKPAKASKG